MVFPRARRVLSRSLPSTSALMKRTSLKAEAVEACVRRPDKFSSGRNWLWVCFKIAGEMQQPRLPRRAARRMSRGPARRKAQISCTSGGGPRQHPTREEEGVIGVRLERHHPFRRFSARRIGENALVGGRPSMAITAPAARAFAGARARARPSLPPRRSAAGRTATAGISIASFS